MEALGGAASVIAVVSLAAKILSICSEYYQDVKDAEADKEKLLKEITAVQDLLKQAQKLGNGPRADKLVASKAHIEKIPSELEEEFERLKKILQPGKRERAKRQVSRRRVLQWPLTKGDVLKALDILERHKTSLVAALSIDQMAVALDTNKVVEDIHSDTGHTLLSSLPRAEGAFYDHWFWQHEAKCLQNTRVELLAQIVAWSKDANSASIFWLNGMAGTGKSTIPRTVARTLDIEKRLAASFFFSRGRGDIGHAGKFFTTIAAQLASHLPEVLPFLVKAVKQHPDISQKGLREQWKHLILDPLSKLKDTPTKAAAMVIVIDALDECDKEEDVQLILSLLEQARNLRPIRLQLFITSRPETRIFSGFRDMPREIHLDFVLHNISPDQVSQDISLYFQKTLAPVKLDHAGLGTPWPDEQVIQQLVTRAHGLFIYAATTCRFIRNPNYHPAEQLSLILVESSDNQQSLTNELDLMYTQILRHSILGGKATWEHEEMLDRFRKSVGSVVVMFGVMAIKDLAALLHQPLWKVKLTLNSLRSVLNVPENETQAIRTLHPSFRDFLLNEERCRDVRLRIDEKEKHMEVFRNCLEVMFRKLRRDMCDLGTPGALSSELSMEVIQQGVSADLQYACRYWVYHFHRGNSCLKDHNRILHFLNTHYLHWLEALGLMREVSAGVLMVTALEQNLAVSGVMLSYIHEMMLNKQNDLSVPHELAELAYDCRRFILWNRSMMEIAPLQVYYSGLLFCPKKSLVREKYKGDPWVLTDAWLLKEPTVLEGWSPLLLTFDGHSRPVNAVAFSPDGKLLASASWDKTVRLWDTSTGGSRGLLEGHSDSVNAVVFSPDSKFVASASYDYTVRLWDVPQRSTIKKMVMTSRIKRLKFSDDGMEIQTDRGSLQPKCCMNPINSGQTNVSPLLAVGEAWITCNTRNVLWLPWDYRPRIFAMNGSCLALALRSGHVCLITFDSATISRDFPPLPPTPAARVAIGMGSNL